ncbi:MAG: aminoacyl-histidine dipeptidase [Ruminococcaceae bacterium]|nr:aminoacyl-histidine dipeptidase [Oscillospiraceae bacterium]
MGNIIKAAPEQVFGYFEQLSLIPRGSGNMVAISDYCMEFAKAHGLDAIRDEANNVIIFKGGTAGYEGAEPIILQGHLDMVCQKDEGHEIDFERDGLDIYVDGDYVKAHGTTLGADNGIAVAMILAILDSKEIPHPPIEAVFTTDEEVGMIGATAMDMDNLNGKRMINIDSEDPGVVTVSCAGGSDFKMTVPLKRETICGDCVTLTIRGLRGGHSGVEINSGRVNANLLMGRMLNHIARRFDFHVISVDGGDKGNAIPVSCRAKIVTGDGAAVAKALCDYADIIKEEIAAREGGFEFACERECARECDAIVSPETGKLVHLLLCAPNGVVEMSAEIENLVETSLNLGILKTEADNITLLFALRSNKTSALAFLEEKLYCFAGWVECSVETGGHYPPWEYNEGSTLQELYAEKYAERFGGKPAIEAIHAGLECGVFASRIPGFDCISIGPEMHDIHTTKERLSISSTAAIYDIILRVLKELK